MEISKLGFHATFGDTHDFPGFLTPVLTQLSFQSLRPPFSHASADVRGENTPKRKFASKGYRTHNHQVMNLTRSLLSHVGGSEAGRWANEGVGHRFIENFATEN